MVNLNEAKEILNLVKLPNNSWKETLLKKCKDYDIPSYISLVKSLLEVSPDTDIKKFLSLESTKLSQDTRIEFLENKITDILNDLDSLSSVIQDLVKTQNVKTIPAITVHVSESSLKESIERNKLWSRIANAFMFNLECEKVTRESLLESNNILKIILSFINACIQHHKLSTLIQTPNIKINETNSLKECFDISLLNSENTLQILINIEKCIKELETIAKRREGQKVCEYIWIIFLQRLFYNILQTQGYTKTFEEFVEDEIPHGFSRF